MSVTLDNSDVSFSSGGSELFDRVVQVSGLAGLIAVAAVTRACSRAGVDPKYLDRGSLARVLPHLEMTLKIYMRADADARMRALRDLLR